MEQARRQHGQIRRILTNEPRWLTSLHRFRCPLKQLASMKSVWMMAHDLPNTQASQYGLTDSDDVSLETHIESWVMRGASLSSHVTHCLVLTL